LKACWTGTHGLTTNPARVRRKRGSALASILRTASKAEVAVKTMARAMQVQIRFIPSMIESPPRDAFVNCLTLLLAVG
jgi:hypothetical protein